MAVCSNTSFSFVYMDKLFPLILIILFSVSTAKSQDCSSLFVTTAVTSNYNGSHVSCFGSSDGQITTTVTGGQAPYTFILNDNVQSNTTGIFNALPAGTYSIKVTDANSCEKVSTIINIVEPAALISFGLVTSDYNGQSISCANSSNGEITLIASGGIGLHTYSINQIPANTSGVNTGVFTGLSANTYTFTVTDQNGCQFITSPIVLTSPPPITADVSSNGGEPDNCTDGGISAVASGGTGAYFFSLIESPGNTTGFNTGEFTGLSAGVYTVQISDLNGCVFITSPTNVTQGSPISASATITSDYNGTALRCFGNSDGQITVEATGGTGNLTYSINESVENVTGSTSGIFSGLSAGTYSFTVTDQAECETVTTPVVLSSPSAISTEVAITSNYNSAHLSCFNAADGEITITAGGGTQPYQYKLNDLSTNSTGVFTGLIANTYAATITDVNNCVSVSESVTLVSPAALHVTGEVIPDQTGNNGGIILAVTGGTTPYDFVWSNGSLLQNLGNVGGGEYSVDVTDANGCFVSTDFEIPVVVSVDSPEPKNSVTLIFDRTQNAFALICDAVKPSRVSIDVIDSHGKPVRNITTKHERNHYQFLLSEEPLSTGFYIARIKIDKDIFVQKFFIR